jgi:hypothetical protein
MEQSPLLNLPVEILHRIFDFCDVETILCTISCVCKRLHSVATHYDRLQLKLDIYRYQEIGRSISPHVLSDCVVSLTFYWSVLKYQKPGIIPDILQCKRLRHLTLRSNDDEGIQSLLIKASNIELVSLTVYPSGYTNKIPFKVISSFIEKSKLQKLSWRNFFYKAAEMSWPDQCKLKFLSIYGCFYNEYTYLLHQLPYLEKFQVDTIDISEKSMSLPSLNFSLHSQLTRLSIRHCSLSMEHLRTLLLKTTKLDELDLHSSNSMFKSITDIHEWEQFIRTELSFLNKLQFFISCEFSPNATVHFDTIIAPFRDPFWLNEKRWFIVCHQIIDKYKFNQFSFFTIPFIEYVDGTTYRSRYPKCGISSKDNTYYINNLARDQITLDTIRDVSIISLFYTYSELLRFSLNVIFH